MRGRRGAERESGVEGNEGDGELAKTAPPACTTAEDSVCVCVCVRACVCVRTAPPACTTAEEVETVLDRGGGREIDRCRQRRRCDHLHNQHAQDSEINRDNKREREGETGAEAEADGDTDAIIHTII